jgi:dCTP deaminase
MSIKSDCWIREHAENHKMIQPFFDKNIKTTGDQKPQRIISYGLSSYGYDVRLENNLRVIHNIRNSIIDPKKFDCKITEKADVMMWYYHFGLGRYYFIMPPHSFALGCTVETIKVPRDVLVICLGKSTYARCGIIVNVTPLEPEWEGHVTLEFSNTTPLPAKIYAGEGVAQMIFLQADTDDVCAISYADRQGKYQGQKGITLPRV